MTKKMWRWYMNAWFQNLLLLASGKKLCSSQSEALLQRSSLSLGRLGNLKGVGSTLRQPQGEKDTLFNLSMPYKTSRNYKATKVVFLKREEESSRCSLEEAVVTGQPGQEGLSGTQEDNQGAEGTPPALSWSVWACEAGVCKAPVKAAERTLRGLHPVPQQTTGT